MFVSVRVGCYAKSIAAGDTSYAYHVSNQNENASVLISRYGEKWSLDEISGQHNREVSFETEYLVMEWLREWNERNS